MSEISRAIKAKQAPLADESGDGVVREAGAWI